MMGQQFWEHVASKFEGAPVRLIPRCHPAAGVECYMVPQTQRIILCCSLCERPILITKLDDQTEVAAG